MLETLNSYIEEQPGAAGLSEPLTTRLRRDRRFTRIAALSVVGHLIFYTLLIKMAVWTVEYPEPKRGGRIELVKVAELAPPLDRTPLRAPIQPREQVDLSRLQYDPDRSDDVNLVERSRKLGDPRGTTRPAGDSRPAQAKTALPPLPPPVAPLESNRTPQSDSQVTVQLPPREAPTPPPQPPADQRSASADTARDSQQQRPGPPAPGLGTRELGLSEVQAQYRAYVRQKIWQVNDRNKPNDWIRDTLSQKASVAFSLTIGRSGEVIALTMIRSSGYSVLDRAAREAILLARPFDGFPPNAGDSIPLTVIVYYEPTHR